MDYKISDVARHLDCSTATVRNYLKQFPHYFSEEAQHPHRKRFSPGDVAILEEIARLSREGYTWNEIPSQLPAPGEIVEEIPSPTLNRPDQQQNALEVLRDQNEQLKVLIDVTIKAKDQTIEVLQGEVSRLRAELDRKNLPFWKKIF